MKGNVSYIAPERALISTTVKEIQPYATISSRNKILSGETSKDITPLKLDWYESTQPPSDAVKNAIKESIDNNENILNWYPELYSRSLRHKLGEYCNRNAEDILVINGSDDALELICKVFLDPGDQVVVPYPTYTHFITYVQSRGADLRKVELTDPFKPDITSILSHVTPDTKLIYIVNPNNPTEVLLSKKQISTICTIASHSIVIVDEAYFEFAGETVMDLIDRNPNLIITRTFSKAWALAGLRIGYLVTNQVLIDQLAKVLNPKSVSVMAQVAAFAALSDKEYMEKYVAEVKTSKKMLLDFFTKFEVSAFDSRANYIMVQHPELNLLLEKMEHENIFVRDRSSFKNLPNFFRITLGTVDQTVELISRLDRILSSF